MKKLLALLMIAALSATLYACAPPEGENGGSSESVSTYDSSTDTPSGGGSDSSGGGSDASGGGSNIVEDGGEL